MADVEASLESLSTSQQEALQQYTSVTDQDIPAAIAVLQRCQWNVQIAVTQFFDGEPAEPAQATVPDVPAPQEIRRQQVLLDEIQGRSSSRTGRSVQSAPRVVPQPESQVSRQAPFILTLLLTPINILTKLFGPFIRIFARLFPFLPRLYHSIFSSRNSSSRKTLSPRDTAARTIREFEEEYGSHNLPFEESGFAAAFDVAKRELKYLLVVLLSPEHDDTSYFVRNTLLAPNVAEFLRDRSNNIILWLGNVADSEAYQVSTSYRVSKLPFAGLIVHTPSVNATAMSVVARIPGSTAPGPFIAKLRKAIAENNEALTQSRATRAEQAAARNMREQQESAYERSLAADRARSQRKKEEEQQRQAAAAEAAKQAENAERVARKTDEWRRWRASQLLPEPSADQTDTVRINLRLPSGERIVRRFTPTAPIEELYAFVECHHLVSSDLEKKPTKPDDFEFEYTFKLVSPMPRQEYGLEKGGTIKERIGRSGSLIVETLAEVEEGSEDEGADD